VFGFEDEFKEGVFGFEDEFKEMKMIDVR